MTTASSPLAVETKAMDASVTSSTTPSAVTDSHILRVDGLERKFTFVYLSLPDDTLFWKLTSKDAMEAELKTLANKAGAAAIVVTSYHTQHEQTFMFVRTCTITACGSATGSKR